MDSNKVMPAADCGWRYFNINLRADIMNSLESGSRSVKLWLAVRLLELFFLGLGITAIFCLIYFTAQLVRSYQ